MFEDFDPKKIIEINDQFNVAFDKWLLLMHIFYFDLIVNEI